MELKQYDTPTIADLGQIEIPAEPPTIEQMQEDWLLMLATVRMLNERVKQLEQQVSEL